jgi:hypothetical protein
MSYEAVQEKSFNLAPAGLVWCWIITYSGLSNNIYTDQILTGNFLLLCGQSSESVHLSVTFVLSYQNLAISNVTGPLIVFLQNALV